MTERIVAAAVRRLESHQGGDGQPMPMVYSMQRPARHHHILHRMPGDALDVDQGFVTSDGRFVDRQEARRIAEARGQLLPAAISSTELYSEDVW